VVLQIVIFLSPHRTTHTLVLSPRIAARFGSLRVFSALFFCFLAVACGSCGCFAALLRVCFHYLAAPLPSADCASPAVPRVPALFRRQLYIAPHVLRLSPPAAHHAAAACVAYICGA
jgi:hypothetical protein